MANDVDYKNELRAAEQEWSEIPKTGDSIKPEFHKTSEKDPLISRSSFTEIDATDFKNSVIPKDSAIIESTVDDDDHEEVCCCLCPKRKVPKDLECLRKSYLFMTSSKFIPTNQIHVNALLTIYTKLMRSNFSNSSSSSSKPLPPPRFGKHWEEIGFQGSDPVTDFRSAGLLPMYLILKSDNQKLTELFNRCHVLDEEHSFPFAVVCINVTVRIMRYLLRKPSKFYRNSDIDTIFTECLKKFVDMYVKEDYTIRDAAKCLKAVEKYLENK